jgi:hypothetical protein
MESREDCLREATECDRLADLANTQATRALLAVAAFQWRKLAEKAAERQKTHWPSLPETIISELDARAEGPETQM